MPLGDVAGLGNVFCCTDENSKLDGGPNLPQQANQSKDGLLEEISSTIRPSPDPSICETASLAALLLRGHAFVPMRLVECVPAALFYWPLIQLASAVTDDIASGVAVGSNGRGNLPGAMSDIWAALLVLLIGKCNDPSAFQEGGGEEFFRE